MMKHNLSILITGTDTGIGKTSFTRLLSLLLRSSGARVSVLKPVETGCTTRSDGTLFASDAYQLWESSSQVQRLEEVISYKFTAPLAPAVVAEQENRLISLPKITRAIRESQQKGDFTLIEGAGGLLVPITWEFSFLDLARKHNMPCLLVVGSRLGALNHAALTFETLSHHGVPVLGYVFNDLFRKQPDGELFNEAALSSNRESFKKLAAPYGYRELAHLPFIPPEVLKDNDKLTEFASSQEKLQALTAQLLEFNQNQEGENERYARG